MSASSAATGASAAPQAASPPGACHLEGDWQLCSVEDRLTHAGLILTRRDAPPEVPFLHTTGTTFGIGEGNDEIDVFIYPSTAERARDTDALDSATASPKGTRHRWQGTPTLVTSNNLAAVIRSERQRQVERLALALGAGLPASR